MVAPCSENQAPSTNIVPNAAVLQEKPLAQSAPRGLKRRASEALAESPPAESPAPEGGAVPEASPPKRGRVTEWITGVVEAVRARLSPLRPSSAPEAEAAPVEETPVQKAAPAEEKPVQNAAPAEETPAQKAVPAEPAPKVEEASAAVLPQESTSWQFHVEQAAADGDDCVAEFLSSTWPAEDEEVTMPEDETTIVEAAEETEGAEEEADRWFIIDRDEVDVFEAVDSDLIIATLHKGDMVEAAGPASIIDEYEMIPIKPTGAIQADFVRWRISEAHDGDIPVAQVAEEQDPHSWQGHVEDAVASGDQDVVNFLSSSWSAVGADTN